MELSVLSQFPWNDEWRTKYVNNNKAIEPIIPEGAEINLKVSFIKKIIIAIENEFKEIEFKDIGDQSNYGIEKIYWNIK